VGRAVRERGEGGARGTINIILIIIIASHLRSSLDMALVKTLRATGRARRRPTSTPSLPLYTFPYEPLPRYLTTSRSFHSIACIDEGEG